jgi:hypothetical protein
MKELELLMQPELTVKIDITDYAAMVHSKFSDILVQAPPGCYVAGKVDPVIRAGELIYNINDTRHKHSLVTLDGVQDAVVNSMNRILIDNKTINTKGSISSKPFLPYTATLIVEAFVKDHMVSFSEYTKLTGDKTVGLLSVFGNFFIEEYRDEYVIGNIYTDLDKILLNLAQDLDFIQYKHKWHIFEVKREDSLLIIERRCDFRVYEWTVQQLKLKEENEPT